VGGYHNLGTYIRPLNAGGSQMPSSDSIKLGIVRGISYGVFGPPGEFMPQARALGAGAARLYVTWNQVEPEPGRYDWTAVDALLAQVEPGDEIWITVVSTSRWATIAASDFLPASPAREMTAYSLFVASLVAHCAGKVTYWQCNNEPSNAGLWTGGPEAYAAQAVAFARAVRSADPGARLVLGGCGFDVLSAPSDSEARRFFHTVLDQAPDAFDLFAVHLYDEPAKVPAHIETVRAMMRAHGDERPVVVGEYGGPTLLGFPSLEPVMQQVMMEAFAGGGPSMDSADLAAQAETPDRKAMRALYAKMASLPPELQMFMQNCPPELAARRDRIASREIVTRNLLAMAEGVTRTMCWNLAPEVPNYRDPYNMMGFLSDKLALMDFDGTSMRRVEPAGHAFRLLADALHGATSVRRLGTEPGIVAIGVERDGRGPLHVLWAEGDAFDGEDAPARSLFWPWPDAAPHATDALGRDQPVELHDGRLTLSLTVTPLLIAAEL
jgi:hypothetical protein